MNNEDSKCLDRAKRFMLYHGRVRPSDTYLKTHPLPDYREGDWLNDAYDLQNDHDVFLAERVCAYCGASYALPETIETVKCSFAPYPIACTALFVGDVCGPCALKEINSVFLLNPELRV